jgi:uncharacterized membrane protein (UPF0127 family)
MPKLPRIVRVIDTTTGVCLAERAPVATSLWARAKGLLGRSELPAGEGLVLWPCTGVHCLGMRFPIDVLHVSKSGEVLRILANMRPYRIGPIVLRSHFAVELPAGTAARCGVAVGHRIALEPVER